MSQSNNVKKAAALKYQLDKENSAPIVVASGMGVAAQKIIDVAIENNVPIFEDDSLSALLTQLDVGREIPPELFQTVVDIYVYFLNYTLPKASHQKALASPPSQSPLSALPHEQNSTYKPSSSPFATPPHEQNSTYKPTISPLKTPPNEEDDDSGFTPF